MPKPPKFVIGELQLAVMGAVWRDHDLSLRRIYRAVLLNYHHVELSTVSTTITRLVERGFLVRTQHKYDRKYSAGITREELVAVFAEKINAA